MFRRKKHEFLKAKCEKIEMHGSRNDARKVFQKIKRMSEGFKIGATFCKDQDLTDIKRSLDLWRAHFNAILNGADTSDSANEMIRPSKPSTLDNATPVAAPDWEDVMASLLNFLKQEEMSLLAS